MKIALLGGTGLAQLPGMEVLRSHAVDTPFGAPSTLIEEGSLNNIPVFFLSRHGGEGAPIPPHRVNYRANIWALRELGCERIVASNAVGAIREDLRPGRLVIPDQLIDYSWGREHTFDDGSSGSLQHIDFTVPYDDSLRSILATAAEDAGIGCVSGAVMGVVQGPRLETAAEVRRMAQDGCDLVGMTGMPEAALARELGIPYAALCMVVNAAAGLGDAEISHAEIRQVVTDEAVLLARLLVQALPALSEG